MKLKELYKELFFVGKRVSDKVMITRVVTTVSVIVACLAAMSFSAYAFFSHSLTSGVNRIQSAVYELEVTPKDGESMAVYTLDNLSGTGDKSYEFTLTPAVKENAATSGYGKIVITVEGAQELSYCTPSIWKMGTDVEGEERIHSYTVQIKVPQGKTASVKFLSQWGTPANPIEWPIIEPYAHQEVAVISDDDTTTTTTTTTTQATTESTAETGETASTAESTDTTAATTTAATAATTASMETTTTAASAETTTVATAETTTTTVTTVTVTDETTETEV